MEIWELLKREKSIPKFPAFTMRSGFWSFTLFTVNRWFREFVDQWNQHVIDQWNGSAVSFLPFRSTVNNAVHGEASSEEKEKRRKSYPHVRENKDMRILMKDFSPALEFSILPLIGVIFG